MSRILSWTAPIVIALTVGLAPAADAANPQPCSGSFLIKDPAGDQGYKQQGATLIPMPENTDVIGIFHRLDAGKVTVNIVVSNLVKGPPSGFATVRYRSYVTVDDTVHYVQALVDANGATFSYGSAFLSSYTEEGTTEGQLFEGKNGVVQIVIPAAIGGKPGAKLGATSGSVGALSFAVPAEAQLPPFYFQADTAPDAAADGPSTTPVACAAAATSAPAAPAAASPAKAVKLTLGSSALSAKRVNAKRSASVVVKTSEPLTGLTASLMRGSKAVGSGKLAKVSGSATLKLKLTAKLSKGSYKLVLAAKRASGAAVKATFKMKVGA